MNRIGQISEYLIVDSLTSTTLNAHSCGYHEVNNLNHDIQRPYGRNDFELIYIIKGTGFFTLNQEEIKVSAGSIIMYPPRTPQFYHYPCEEETSYYSMHFIGANIHLELSPIFKDGAKIFTIGHNDAICNTLEATITEFINRGSHYPQICDHYLYSILLILLRHENDSTNPRSSYEPTIQKTAHFMRQSYAEKYSLQEYATYANLSVSRFTHNFEDIFTISPMKFIAKVRLEHACWLLMNTQIQISDVAQTVGYDDPLYFSRAFRKEHHMSPSAYRKNTLPEEKRLL